MRAVPSARAGLPQQLQDPFACALPCPITGPETCPSEACSTARSRRGLSTGIGGRDLPDERDRRRVRAVVRRWVARNADVERVRRRLVALGGALADVHEEAAGDLVATPDRELVRRLLEGHAGRRRSAAHADHDAVNRLEARRARNGRRGMPGRRMGRRRARGRSNATIATAVPVIREAVFICPRGVVRSETSQS
jgi:hypothetical protein